MKGGENLIQCETRITSLFFFSFPVLVVDRSTPISVSISISLLISYNEEEKEKRLELISRTDRRDSSFPPKNQFSFFLTRKKRGVQIKLPLLPELPFCVAILPNKRCHILIYLDVAFFIMAGCDPLAPSLRTNEFASVRML